MDINEVWPEWTEDCILGEGSFGKVYRAKREDYGRTFYSAIKVLSVPKNQQEIQHVRAQGMSETEVGQYFRSVVDSLLNEITLMDNLKGAKNVVGIEDYKIVERQYELGWDIFIRMELLTPFDSFVSNPDFSQKDVLKLGIDICSALEICEQNAILHRDIKPDNIFVSRFGEYKLGDFGIARKLESTQANFSRKGTLNYMAPEVYKSEEYGSAVDIYSLGLVLYTLLNNNRTAFLPPYPQPIAYKDNEEALAKRLSGAPLPPPCNASHSLGVVIVKACANNPRERYASATEFKNALIREWNALQLSGENPNISVSGKAAPAEMEPFKSTTNDMTANGYVVAGAYIQDTTVLEGDSIAQGYQNSERLQEAYAGELYFEGSYKKRGSKLCHVLAIPLMVTVCIMALYHLIAPQGPETGFGDVLPGVAALGLSAVALFAWGNKAAVGIWAILLSLSPLIPGVKGVLEGLQGSFPIESALYLISGILMLFGGFCMICQREVRLGGLLCLYSIVPQWLYRVYLMIYGDYSASVSHIMLTVAGVAVCVWAYGYGGTEGLRGFRRVLHITGYVFTAVAGAFAAMIAWNTVIT